MYAFLCPRLYPGVIFLFSPKAYLADQESDEHYIKENNKRDAKNLKKIN